MPGITDVPIHHNSHSPCYVRASAANKQKSIAKARGLGAQCVYMGHELARCVYVTVSSFVLRFEDLFLRGGRRGAG
jgi:hypothetical protein